MITDRPTDIVNYSRVHATNNANAPKHLFEKWIRTDRGLSQRLFEKEKIQEISFSVSRSYTVVHKLFSLTVMVGLLGVRSKTMNGWFSGSMERRVGRSDRSKLLLFIPR